MLGNVLACRLPGDSVSKEAGRWGGTQLTHSGIIIQTSKSQEKLQVQMFSRRDIVRNCQELPGLLSQHSNTPKWHIYSVSNSASWTEAATFLLKDVTSVLSSVCKPCHLEKTNPECFCVLFASRVPLQDPSD